MKSKFETLMKWFFVCTLGFSTLSSLCGCEMSCRADDDPLEELGDDIEDAAEELGD